MLGDRVLIVSAQIHSTVGEVLPVYSPATGPNNVLKENYDGTFDFERKGGVKVGSSGHIHGAPMKIHRTQLLHLQNIQETASALGGTNDYVNMFPVFLDFYQQVGWFPVEHIKIMGGDVLR
jgi:hypothetical protein